MRGNAALLLIGLSLFSPGCALVTDTALTACRNVTDTVDDVREAYRNRQWAEAAWHEMRAAEPGAAYSDDFAAGFKRGFADFLDNGGTGAPPVLAPPQYRRLRYQTPQGYLAIEDWFAGYRRGSAAAQQSGARGWVTGPTSLREPSRPTRPPGVIMLAPIPSVNLGAPVPGTGVPEILPPPARVTPAPPPEGVRPTAGVAGEEPPGPVLVPIVGDGR